MPFIENNPSAPPSPLTIKQTKAETPPSRLSETSQKSTLPHSAQPHTGQVSKNTTKQQAKSRLHATQDTSSTLQSQDTAPAKDSSNPSSQIDEFIAFYIKDGSLDSNVYKVSFQIATSLRKAILKAIPTEAKLIELTDRKSNASLSNRIHEIFAEHTEQQCNKIYHHNIFQKKHAKGHKQFHFLLHTLKCLLLKILYHDLKKSPIIDHVCQYLAIQEISFSLNRDLDSVAEQKIESLLRLHMDIDINAITQPEYIVAQRGLQHTFLFLLQIVQDSPLKQDLQSCSPDIITKLLDSVKYCATKDLDLHIICHAIAFLDPQIVNIFLKHIPLIPLSIANPTSKETSLMIAIQKEIQIHRLGLESMQSTHQLLHHYNNFFQRKLASS